MKKFSVLIIIFKQIANTPKNLVISLGIKSKIQNRITINNFKIPFDIFIFFILFSLP
jgi:hypothetical protein